MGGAMSVPPSHHESQREARAHVRRVPHRVGTPLDADEIDPHAIVEITVEFDEGEEVLTPKINERFGSYDLNEAARYIYFLSNHILKGGRG
jgi:hypothetical protein